jgi:uncharacterized phage protein (TIGR02216 family)
MSPAFDWPALLRAGLQHLRLRPAEFWALTPAELALMLGLDQRPLPMGRARLLQLSEQFPDRTPA